MSLFSGILRTEDLNAALTTFDPEIIQEGITAILAKHVADRNAAQQLLVSDQVTVSSQRIREGAIDEGQELGPDGRPLETHVGGYYDVGYPIKRLGWAVGWNEETFAYMTVDDLDREVNAKVAGNARRHTRDIMKAVMLKANYDFADPSLSTDGTVTVRRLANTDGTLYGEDQTEDTHYLVSGYAKTAISPTNNPFATLATEIREHFDTTTRIIAFVSESQRAEILADLTTFVDTAVVGIEPANDTSVAINGGFNVPGDFLGIDSASGVYVYVWNRIPDAYIYAQAVDETPPVVRRVPAPVSLQGFTLKPEESHLPFYKRSWWERFGYGVGNRLSGAAMFLDAGGTYTDPTL